MSAGPLHQIEHRLHDLTSSKRGHSFWGMLLVMGICAALVWWKHSTWLREPNNYMLTESPDGFKNYMTTAWHVQYDTSYVHYRGMNYPYGEHVLFTDNQPILSTAMQWWQQHMGDLTERTVGIVNMAQVISLIFGCCIIFLLFRKLHLPVWYAGLVSLAMIFLTPQQNRFYGHFGLSHAWIFPLLLLLLCRYEERYSRRYQSLLIGILVWFSAQLHFYYFGLAALFLTLYTGFQLLWDPAFRNFRVRFSHWVVMVLLPFALLNLWIHWADYAPDRPANPYGFTAYIGRWEGVLLPYEGFPLYKWIDTHLVHIRRIDTEAQAYAGAVAFLFTLWIIGLFFKRVLHAITKKKVFARYKIFPPSWEEMAYHRVHLRYLNGIFAAAFTLTVFSCGFPFAIDGMEWMVKYFGPLRQFRGLGRFTWAYFYVINLLAFYFCWNWSRRFKGIRGGKAKWLHWVIALAPLALLVYEAVVFQKTHQTVLRPNPEKKAVLAPAPDHWINKVDFKPYQALLPLPYYHMGSENIWMDVDYGLFQKTQLTALQMGVPDMGVNMSRTPLSKTLKSIQFTLPPCESPLLLNDLPDSRPIALMVNADRWDEVQQRYPHLLQKSRPVYDGYGLKIFSFVPDSLRVYRQEYLQNLNTEMNAQAGNRFGPWLSNHAERDFYYQSFDSLSGTSRVFQGKGAFAGTMADSAWIWNAPWPKGAQVLSLWVYVGQDLAMTQELKIFENSLADGHEIQLRHEGLRFYLKALVGEWALFELPFEVKEDNSRLRIFLQKKGVEQPFFLDEVLLRPAGTTLYRRSSGWIVRNNYWFKTSE